ncbi:hypothetical protein HQ531_12585 [bacterium]|nr:hypothetical protein [bacterium]
MLLSSIRRQENGHVIFVSMIMVLVSLGFTLGYLQFVMGERFVHLKHVAKAQAKFNAIAGLGKFGNPYLLSAHFTSDTLLSGEDLPDMRGYSDSINCMFIPVTGANEDQLEASAKGVAFFHGFNGEDIEVTHKVKVRYTPDTFAKYMYFTNTEEPAGPWAGSYVSFGSGEILEGIVYSNDNITMSAFGCPDFINSPDGQISEVYTAGNFIMNTCSEGIFEGIYEDSAAVIDWPPFTGHERVKNAANWIIHGDDLIRGIGMEHDTLLMTEIEFRETGFVVKQWPYIIPPFVTRSSGDPGYPSFADSMKQFYPYTFSHNPFMYPDGMNTFGNYGENPIDWSHYDFLDFPRPDNQDDFYTYREIFANEGVIWIEGGQVRVYGQIRGRFTVATSADTPYRRFNNYSPAMLKNNIWIIDDLIYEDSFEGSGVVREGSNNRLGLLSAADIIVANTLENGAHNGAVAGSIIINAAMIAMNQSFKIQYWQNTTNNYNFLDGGLVKGDGQGQDYYGGTGNTDYRGVVNIWGSVIQSKRGYLKRNNPGPYANTIGYDKNYNYDYNLRDFPPPAWPENRNADGTRNLSVAAFGDITQ